MDKNCVKILSLSNQRQFKFSYYYDEIRLAKYFIEADVLYKAVSDLPILPDLASSLDEELIKRSIFGTAAIEGNPLSVEQVSNLVAEEENQTTTGKAEKEIYNLKNTYNHINQLLEAKEDRLIEEEDIKTVHQLITKDILYSGNTAGQYRHHQVKVGNIEHGGIYTPPKIYDDINLLMKEFIIWINSDAVLKLNPIVRSTLAHYHLALVHPFGDGNGRTARAIEALLLRKSDIKYVPLMLSNYYYNNIDDYYIAFSESLKKKDGDVTDFLEFVIKGFIKSLYEIKDRITYFIRKFTLKEAYSNLLQMGKINNRQFSFLLLVLETNQSFSQSLLKNELPFKFLYEKLSDRTLKRDINSLLELELVKKLENSTYELNFYYLG